VWVKQTREDWSQKKRGNIRGWIVFQTFGGGGLGEFWEALGVSSGQSCHCLLAREKVE